MIAENLIKVKGFEDLIIFINGENVSVIVKSDKLEEKGGCTDSKHSYT